MPRPPSWKSFVIETWLDAAQLRSLAGAVSVDTYALTVPSKAEPVAVSLYCDEKSHAKQLPLNERAIGLAAEPTTSVATQPTKCVADADAEEPTTIVAAPASLGPHESAGHRRRDSDALAHG